MTADEVASLIEGHTQTTPPLRKPIDDLIAGEGLPAKILSGAAAVPMMVVKAKRKAPLTTTIN